MTTSTALTVREYQALATFTPKYFPGASFILSGETYTTDQAMAIVNTGLAAASAVETARTAGQGARIALEKTEAQNGPIVKELRQVIAIAVANDPTKLADFLITPKKVRAPLSAAARAAAEAKAKSTREARGTKGKVQKAAISGTVTGVTITPIQSGTAAASTSVASATPAGTGAPATTSAPTAPAATVTPVISGVVVSASPAPAAAQAASGAVITPAVVVPNVANGSAPHS